MGLMKIHQVIKKWKGIHERHLKSWEDAQRQIIREGGIGSLEGERLYNKLSYEYQNKGNKLFTEMVEEISKLKIFPEKTPNHEPNR